MAFPPCFLRKKRKKSQLFAVFLLTSPCHLCILFKQPLEVYYCNLICDPFWKTPECLIKCISWRIFHRQTLAATRWPLRQSAIFSATPTADGAALLLCVKAQIHAECARCLEPIQREYAFEREYNVRMRDVEDPDFELPCQEKGCLDLEELVFQELIFEVPTVLLCSPDCQGPMPHLRQEEGGRMYLPTGRQCCPCRCTA